MIRPVLTCADLKHPPRAKVVEEQNALPYWNGSRAAEEEVGQQGEGGDPTVPHRSTTTKAVVWDLGFAPPFSLKAFYSSSHFHLCPVHPVHPPLLSLLLRALAVCRLRSNGCRAAHAVRGARR